MKEFDVAIIGAGPAGLSAALYLARANKKVIVLDSGAPGGKLLTLPHIENYPGVKETNGMELAQDFYSSATRFGAIIDYGAVQLIRKEENAFLVKSDIEEYKTKAVIVATGLTNVPSLLGEKEFLHRGVSYCATCDGRFYLNQPMAVIGDSEQAEAEASYLSDLASKLYFFRSKQINEESPYFDSLTKKENVILMIGDKVIAIEGQDKVNGLRYEKEGKEERIEVSAVFPLLGEKSVTSFLSELDVNLEKGFILTDEEMRTNVPGLFAIGDIRKKTLRQVVTAASDGAIASSSVIRYLKEYGTN